MPALSRIGRIVLLAGLALASCAAACGADLKARDLTLRPANGRAAATVKGTIQGRQTFDYRVQARQGQSIAVGFSASNASAYFNLLPPGDETALFVGSTGGNRYAAELPVDGVYTLRVYLMRSAARRHEYSRFVLDVGLADGGRAAAAASNAGVAVGPVFARNVELQDIRFAVTSHFDGQDSTLRITPSGLEIDNSPYEQKVKGTVTGVETADLNADGSPEIYVYTMLGGTGSVLAFSANRRKSLSAITLPALTPKAANGYSGGDEFAVVENRLVRRFPLKRGGGDRKATVTRQLQYKLVPGEATWTFKLDRVVEY